MNHLQTNTTGLNAVIKTLQTDIYNALDSKYSFDIEGFGKVHRNPLGDQVIPEVWDETEGQYKEVYLDDSNPYSFCFIDDQQHTTDDFDVYGANVKIAVIVKLTELDSTSRVDSQAHRDLVEIVRNDTTGQFEMDKGGSLLLGVDNVFNGFKRDQITHDNMQPWHIFAIEGKVRYELKTTCND